MVTLGEKPGSQLAPSGQSASAFSNFCPHLLRWNDDNSGDEPWVAACRIARHSSQCTIIFRGAAALAVTVYRTEHFGRRRANSSEFRKEGCVLRCTLPL